MLGVLFRGVWGIGLVALCSPAPVQPLPVLDGNARIRPTYCLLQLTFAYSSVLFLWTESEGVKGLVM